MRGVHPDVIFGEAARQASADPYCRAMKKLREAHPNMRPSELRARAMEAPHSYSLTAEEIAAIRKVAAS